MRKLWYTEDNMLKIDEAEIRNNLRKEIAFLNETNIASITMKHQGKFFQIPQLWQLTA
ncbi:MAG: hypothetical protein GX197_08185 [Firmicutes bacterium]|nr:hypothetical protein [Bacillota bacterium]